MGLGFFFSILFTPVLGIILLHCLGKTDEQEKTNKVSVFYEEMKKSVENVSPYRWDLLNRMADRSLRV